MTTATEIILTNLVNNREKKEELIQILDFCDSEESKMAAIKFFCEKNFSRNLSGMLEKSVVENVLKSVSWKEVLTELISIYDNSAND